MALFKLAVSDRIEFDVKFSLNDNGVEKPFGMRLAARRQALTEQEQEMREGAVVKEFLDGRELEMLAWIGKSPLVGEDGKALPAGATALQALYDLVGGMVSLVFANYLQANGAKGRSGN